MTYPLPGLLVVRIYMVEKNIEADNSVAFKLNNRNTELKNNETVLAHLCQNSMLPIELVREIYIRFVSHTDE